MALVGTTAIPSFLTRTAFASATSTAKRNQKVVVLFQRGAADGLNMVVPHAESYYYKARTGIAIPRNQVLDLDGFFGLHPAMAEFKQLWEQKHLAIVHAVGSPDPTRSHFDAQDYMESGTPGERLQSCQRSAVSSGQFGNSMKQIAQLLKANLGVEVAFADIGGWDHHVNEGNVDGQLARSLRIFSQGISSFWRDMGDEAENVTLVSMSEFGRGA